LYDKVLYPLDIIETDYFGLQFSDASNTSVSLTVIAVFLAAAKYTDRQTDGPKDRQTQSEVMRNSSYSIRDMQRQTDRLTYTETDTDRDRRSQSHGDR